MTEIETEKKVAVDSSHIEDSHHHHHGLETIEILAANEDEPQSPYELGWRTIVALIALSMGNVCAALSNTASLTDGLSDDETDRYRQTRLLNFRSPH